jgi:exportin-2 (importin alpha re-exporter)
MICKRSGCHQVSFLKGLEYVRRDMEGSDVDTRRRITIEFVRGLRVLFNQEVTAILKNYVSSLLQEYATNPTKNWKSKDAAMYIVYALSVEKKTEEKGITAVNDCVNILEFFGHFSV